MCILYMIPPYCHWSSILTIFLAVSTNMQMRARLRDLQVLPQHLGFMVSDLACILLHGHSNWPCESQLCWAIFGAWHWHSSSRKMKCGHYNQGWVSEVHGSSTIFWSLIMNLSIGSTTTFWWNFSARSRTICISSSSSHLHSCLVKNGFKIVPFWEPKKLQEAIFPLHKEDRNQLSLKLESIPSQDIPMRFCYV